MDCRIGVGGIFRIPGKQVEVLIRALTVPDVGDK